MKATEEPDGDEEVVAAILGTLRRAGVTRHSVVRKKDAPLGDTIRVMWMTNSSRYCYVSYDRTTVETHTPEQLDSITATMLAELRKDFPDA